MARAQGARAQMALAFETVYGTAPAGGYTRVPFASTSLGSEQPLITSELLLSIETAMPEVPRYAMYSGCVLDQFSWQMQRSGLLTATAKLVAQGETVGTTTAAGTPAEPALKRFGHFNGSITRNGTALGNVVSAEITYANNLSRIETIRSDGKIDGADPSIAALTGRVEVRFADQVLVDQALRRRSLRAPRSAIPCPRARAPPSLYTPSTCRGRGSRSPGRRACRRPSTGRRPGTPV